MVRYWLSRFVRRIAAVLVVTVASAALVQCTDVSDPATTSADPTSAPPAEPSPPIDSPSPTAPAPPPGPSPSPAPAPPAPAPAAVHPVTAAELGPSWRPECPIAPEGLRRVEVDHVGFDGKTHRGELIVHADLVPEVIAIFDELRQLGFPIEKMRTVEHYPGAEDELSMQDNNTSAFNCRGIPGSDAWSYHAYGRAIDINPLLNPYIDSSGEFQPQNAQVYLDRSRIDPGILHDGDPAVQVFTDRGWRWGGHWQTPLDYQHFELK